LIEGGGKIVGFTANPNPNPNHVHPIKVTHRVTHLVIPTKVYSPANFQPMPVVAKRLDGSRCHLVGR